LQHLDAQTRPCRVGPLQASSPSSQRCICICPYGAYWTLPAPHRTTTTTTTATPLHRLRLTADRRVRTLPCQGPVPSPPLRLTTLASRRPPSPIIPPPPVILFLHPHASRSIEGIHDQHDNGAHRLPHPVIASIPSSHPIPSSFHSCSPQNSTRMRQHPLRPCECIARGARLSPPAF
jgi:hypothetical protein